MATPKIPRIARSRPPSSSPPRPRPGATEHPFPNTQTLHSIKKFKACHTRRPCPPSPSATRKILARPRELMVVSSMQQHHPHHQQQGSVPPHLQQHSRPSSVVHQQHHSQASAQQSQQQQQQQHSSAYSSGHSVYQQPSQAASAQDHLPYYAHPSPYSTPGATSGYTSAGKFRTHARSSSSRKRRGG